MDQINKSAMTEEEITEIHVHVGNIMQVMYFIVHVHILQQIFFLGMAYVKSCGLLYLSFCCMKILHP